MITTRVTGRIATVTINSPPLNILTSALQDELRMAFEGLRAREDHNAVFLQSGLPGKFSAGADVAEHMGVENCRRMLKAAHALIAEVLACPVPTVCVVDGPCIGGAFELALACDQLVATSASSFGTPEIRLGCYPPAALVLMPQKLPPLLGAELIQLGRIISAHELAARGSGISLDRDTSELAAAFAALPRAPLVEATLLLRAGAASRFSAEVGGIEQAYLERLLELPDSAEGPAAFLAKREPKWESDKS